MTEDDARAVIAERWGQDSISRLSEFERLLHDESARQNLISPSSMASLWTRHFFDSAQLCRFDARSDGVWIDVGTGAGFPGIVVGLLHQAPMVLVEPRGRRVSFLRSVIDHFGLNHITVFEGKVETLTPPPARVISARAVASMDKLLIMTSHLRDARTTLIFPRGRTGRDELANLPAKWQKLFHVEQSLTDPESLILVAQGAA